jgi:phosphoribosylformimino-5-aminoimidazole carboxamide ribotide isomerase
MNEEFIPAALAAVGTSHLAVAIDARGGYVAVRGWTETSGRQAHDLARDVLQQGIGTLVYTDIDRDGMLGGADLFGALELQAMGARVIASGGVAALADIHTACAEGLAGIIVGRALYEGRFNLVEAIQASRCTPR